MNHIRAASVAGLLYGVLMGGFFAFQALQQGRPGWLVVAIALGSALGCGVLFGLAMYGFGRLPWVRRQVELQPGDLLDGETLRHSTLCNLVVEPRAFGLNPFAFGDLQFLAGLKDKEIIGGALHVTDLRLLFKSHRMNRLHGAVSIFLPSITRTEQVSRWPWKRVRVHTRLTQIELASTDAAGLGRHIEQARADFGPAQSALLDPLRRALPGVERLQTNAALNAVNDLIHRGTLGQNLVETALSPLTALAGLLVSEAFDRTLAERWSRRVQR